MSHALFPEKSSFQLRKGFCVLAKKLFERPCVSPQKRALLEENFPKLCGLIKSRQNLIGNCDNWPQQFFNRPGIYSYISVYTYLPIYTCPYIHRIYIYIPTYIYLPIHPKEIPIHSYLFILTHTSIGYTYINPPTFKYLPIHA